MRVNWIERIDIIENRLVVWKKRNYQLLEETFLYSWQKIEIYGFRLYILNF